MSMMVAKSWSDHTTLHRLHQDIFRLPEPSVSVDSAHFISFPNYPMKFTTKSASMIGASLLLLAACGANPEHVAMKAYLSSAHEIASSLEDAGSKFESIMTSEANPLAMSEGAKTQLDAIITGLKTAQSTVASLPVPDALKDVHPLLSDSLGNMLSAMETVVAVAKDPTKAESLMDASLETKVETGQKQADEYMSKLESVLKEKFPDLMAEMDDHE